MSYTSELRRRLNEERSAPPDHPTLQVVPIPVSFTSKDALKQAAKTYTGEALSIIVAAMKSEDLPIPQRVAAAVEILNRGWGKPGAEISLSEETLAVLAPIMVPKKVPLSVMEGELVSPGAAVEIRSPPPFDTPPFDTPPSGG